MSNLFHDEGPPATGKKVMLATPSYDAPAASYTFAIARSREALTEAGIQSAYLLLQGLCHVDDARNAIVRHFLASDCTDLMFLDADVDWEPQALVQICKRDIDLVGGVYPYRREGGENMPVRLLDGSTQIVDGLLEVDGLPTGFMKIKRHVLERMAKSRPRYFDKLERTALIFDRPTPGDDMTRWGGDVDFCNRWKAMGGRMFAEAEIRLGHKATVIVRDSLGASIRRVSGTALAHIVPRVRQGIETDDDFNEAFKYAGNPYAGDPGVLAVCTRLARNCRGPIIEAGSGLSSVFMGAVSTDKVYSLEHVEHYAAQTLAWCEEASVANVGICCAPLKDFWYDLDKFELPQKFALGFCDGPPRFNGTRMRFFEELASRCSAVLVDDMNTDHQYVRSVHEWAAAHGKTVTMLGRTALVAHDSLLRQAA
jgi:hypothetical protein